MNKKHKKSYTKPQLSSLGSAQELTLGSSWGHGHDQNYGYSYSHSSSYSQAGDRVLS